MLSEIIIDICMGSFCVCGSTESTRRISSSWVADLQWRSRAFVHIFDLIEDDFVGN